MNTKLNSLKNKNNIIAITCIGIILITAACNNLNVYAKQKFFPVHEWKTGDSVQFSFDITDTIARYNVFIVLRHTDEYAFNNIWLNITSHPPQSAPSKQMFDLKLADNANGWLGTGMGDIFEHKIKINTAPLQLRKGNYTISLEQIMRENPLKHLLNVGIRIEKIIP